MTTMTESSRLDQRDADEFFETLPADCRNLIALGGTSQFFPARDNLSPGACSWLEARCRSWRSANLHRLELEDTREGGPVVPTAQSELDTVEIHEWPAPIEFVDGSAEVVRVDVTDQAHQLRFTRGFASRRDAALFAEGIEAAKRILMRSRT